MYIHPNAGNKEKKWRKLGEELIKEEISYIAKPRARKDG